VDLMRHPLKIVAAVSMGAAHQVATASAFLAGAARHGVHGDGLSWFSGAPPPPAADAYLCWGWRKGKALRARTGKPVLVMERGYIGDRFRWVSLGWNGLNGRAFFAKSGCDGTRLARHFPAVLDTDWKSCRSGPAVIMGQVAGDAALEFCDWPRWQIEALRSIERLGLSPRFRPHPVSIARGHKLHFSARLPRIDGALNEVLAKAALVVTWNSNSGVDAALAGVPVIACDIGSMAWDVAAKSLAADPFDLPSPAARLRWAQELAWCQWLPEEIASGAAWEHIGKACLDGSLQTDAARA